MDFFFLYLVKFTFFDIEKLMTDSEINLRSNRKNAN